MDVEERKMALDMAQLHLDSLKAVLQMVEQNRQGNVETIKDMLIVAEDHLKHMEEG